MKKIDRQNKNFQEMMNDTSKEGLEYRDFVINIYRRYKKELENRSTFTKILVFIFGDPSVLGEDISNEYGKHNLNTII